MAGIGFLDGIHAERANGIGHDSALVAFDLLVHWPPSLIAGPDITAVFIESMARNLLENCGLGGVCDARPAHSARRYSAAVQ